MQQLALALLLAQAVFRPDPALMTPQAPVAALAHALVLRAELFGAFAPAVNVRPDGTVVLGTPTIRLDPERLLDEGELSLHVREGGTLDHLVVVDVRAEKQPFGNWAAVVTLDEAGARAFADFTRKYDRQYLEIRVDGVLVSRPFIAGPVTHGRLLINDNFDERGAERVVAGLRLPWRAQLVRP